MFTSEQTALASLLADPSAPLKTRVLAGDSLRYELAKEERVWTAHCVAAAVIAVGHEALREGYDDEVYNALERAYITRAPNDFHAYLIALEWNREAKSRFYQPRMTLLKPVGDALTAMMVWDTYDIVMLSMPPRVGKSTLGLFFLSWCASRNPGEPILATGYAESITKMFHTGVKEVYENSEYNYRAIFPLIDLVGVSADDLTLDFRNDSRKVTRKYKSLTCRAIDGSLTGATEARQLLYVDDLIKDIVEALSPGRLQSACTKLKTNVYSRRKEGCKELHIGTRWSVHDPMGMVERENDGNPRCKVITLPALDPETDESNFDFKDGTGRTIPGVGFTTHFYRVARDGPKLDGSGGEDEITWQCVYQQQPIEREGLLFPAEDLTYVKSLAGYDLKDNPPDDIFAFCDVAFGGGDYLSLPIAMQYGDDPPIIYDWVFNKGHYEVTEPIVAGRLIALKVRRAMFEANNGGEFYANDVDGLVQAKGHPMHLYSQRAPSNKSKAVRIEQHSPAIRKFVFLDPTSKDASLEYRLAMQNLTTYTMSGKNLHDDAPDSLAGLAAMMRTNLNATAVIYDRHHI